MVFFTKARKLTHIVSLYRFTQVFSWVQTNVMLIGGGGGGWGEGGEGIHLQLGGASGRMLLLSVACHTKGNTTFKMNSLDVRSGLIRMLIRLQRQNKVQNEPNRDKNYQEQQ